MIILIFIFENLWGIHFSKFSIMKYTLLKNGNYFRQPVGSDRDKKFKIFHYMKWAYKPQ